MSTTYRLYGTYDSEIYEAKINHRKLPRQEDRKEPLAQKLRNYEKFLQMRCAEALSKLEIQTLQ
jgi:hypothetical protein